MWGMKGLEAIGGAMPALPLRQGEVAEFVQVRFALQRVMAFLGVSIDDVINDAIARRKVAGYYKLHRWIERRVEVVELERQWNPLDL